MSRSTTLSKVCPHKLSEIYDTLFELQQRLEIHDDYLMNTTRNEQEDELKAQQLKTLLDASKLARDYLVIWLMKQSVMELNVTISLVTAKIKFIEYKLGLCEGLDLHQACSLSLVNFCSILSNMTVVTANPGKRKTLKKVTKELDFPVWISHYRNQICHTPSESPCISILVPLVIRSLDYMRDSFWTALLERETFDAKGFRKLIQFISKFTSIISVNEQLQPRKGVEYSKKQLKILNQQILVCKKACRLLRKSLLTNSEQAVHLTASFITKYKTNDKTRNCALIIEQVILARCLERFTSKLITIATEAPKTSYVLTWLQQMVNLIGLRKRELLKHNLRKLELNVSQKMFRLTEITSLKCCHLSYRIMFIEHPIASKLLVKMRHKLAHMLGKPRTLTLIDLTRAAKLDSSVRTKQIMCE